MLIDFSSPDGFLAALAAARAAKVPFVSGTTGLAEDRLLRAAVDARLGPHTSVQGSWDNLSTIVASGIGNVGGGFRWRLEFE